MFKDYLEKIREWLSEQLQPVVTPLLKQARERLDPLIAQARGRYQKLEPREKLLVRIGGAVFGLFLIYNLIYIPIVDLSSGLQGKIVQRQHDLAEVRRLAGTYAQLKSEVAAAEHHTVPNSKDFSLFSVIEASLTKTVGHEKIGSITPGSDKKLTDGFTEYSVQLKLDNVNLAQLVDALYGINTLAMPIGVSNIRIQRRSQDTHSYDVDMTCVALARNA